MKSPRLDEAATWECDIGVDLDKINKCGTDLSEALRAPATVYFFVCVFSLEIQASYNESVFTDICQLDHTCGETIAISNN